MKYVVTTLEQFTKRFYEEIQKGRDDVFPDEGIYLSKEDLKQYYDNSIVLMALEGETLAGASCSLICKEPTNPDYYGTNLFFYVFKPWRNSLVPGKLLKGTEQVCKHEGLKYYKWDVVTTSPLIECFEKREDYKKESIIYNKLL